MADRDRVDGSAADAPEVPTDEAPEAAAPEAPAEAQNGALGFAARGRMRRRARFLRRARELAYRDLGGLVFELHRFGQRNDELVTAKLTMLGHLDGELRALEDALHQRREVTVLREAGVAACPRCAAIHSSDDRFCPTCGLSMRRQAQRPIAGPPLPLDHLPPAAAGEPPPSQATPQPPQAAPPPTPAAPPPSPAAASPSSAAASPSPAAAPPSPAAAPRAAERAAEPKRAAAAEPAAPLPAPTAAPATGERPGAGEHGATGNPGATESPGPTEPPTAGVEPAPARPRRRLTRPRAGDEEQPTEILRPDSEH